MTEDPEIIKQLREEERIGLFSSSSELEQILPGEANEEMQEGLYSSMDTSEDFDLEGNDNKLLLENTDEDMRLILDEVSDLILFLDLKGKLLDINKAGLEFSGFERKEVIGKYFWRIPGVFSKKNIPKYIKAFKDALKGKKTKDFTASLKDKNGKKHIMTFSVFPKKVDGKIKYITVVSKDVTKLKEIKHHYDLVSQNTSDMISILSFSINPKIIYVSPSHKDCLGYDLKELIGKKIFDFIHPDDKKNLSNLVKRHIANKGKKILTGKDEKIVERLEYRIKDKKGNWHYLDSTANLADGQIVSISRDVTEKKGIEEKIKQSQENYETIFNSSTDSVFIHDFKTGEIIDVNKCVLDKFGYTKEEIKNLNVGDLSTNKPPYTQKEAAEWIKKAASEGPQKFEWLAKTKKGELIWYENSLQKVNIGGKERVLVIGRDITDRKKTEEKLCKKNAELKYTFNATPDALIFADTNRNIKKINPSFEKLFGYKEKELIGKKTKILYANKEEFYKQGQERFNVKARAKYEPYEIEYKKKNGSVFLSETIGTPIVDDNDEVVGLVASIRDITDEIKTKEKLIDSERRLKDAEKTAKIGYVEWDCEHQKAIWSDTIFELYERDIELGTPPYEGIMKFHAPEDAKRLEEAVTLAITKGIPYELDLKVNLPSGKIAYHHVIGNPVKNKEGKVTKILGTVQDITDRKKAQDALKESQEKFKQYFDKSPYGVFVADEKGNYVDVNKEACKTTGYTKEELLKMNLLDLFSEENREDAQESFKNLKEKGEYKLEIPYIRKDGSKHFWIIRAVKISDDRLVGFTKDITNEKKKERELKQSEERYRTLLESSEDSIYVLGYDWKHILVNNAAIRFTGRTKEELIGKRLQDVFPGVEKTPFFKTFEKVMKTREFDSVVNVYEFEDGRKGYYEVNVTPVSEGILCMSRDITKRKEAEEEIRKSEEKYRELFNNALVGIDIHNSDGSVFAVNKAAEDIFGLSEGELKKKNLSFWKGKLIKPDGAPMESKDFPLSIVTETKKPSEGVIVGLKMFEKDNPRWFLHSARPIIDKNGEIDKVVTSFVEITDRKKAEERLKESEELLNFAITQTTVPVIIAKAPDVDIIYHNKAAYEMLQKRPKDIKDITLERHREFWPTFRPDGTPYNIDDLPLTKAVKRGFVTKDEEIIVKKDGKEHWISASAAPLVDKEGDILAGIVVFPEITRQKEAEQKKEKTLKDTQFLSKSLIKISKSKTVDEACNDIGEELYNYCGSSIVAVNIYDKEENVFLNRAVYGIEDSGKIEKILGKELSKMRAKVPKEIHEEVKKGTILRPKEGLYELFFGAVPKPVCKTVESVMKIKDIFIVPLYHDKKLFGNLMIFIKKREREISSSTLEAFGYQCSVVIQRLIAEEELRDSEEKHRNMIELSPDGIATSDLKGKITSVNKSFLDITGFSKEEIVGKHVSRLPTISFKEFPNYMKVYKDILMGKKTEPFIFRWKHKNGEMRWGECRYTIIKKEGKKVGVQVVLRDITEKRKHDEEIRKFKTISDKARYGVNINTIDGTTVYVNDAFAEMHGYKKEELVGKPHDILHIKEEITTNIKDARERLKRGEHVITEETHKKKDGTLIPVQVNASAIPDNDGKTKLIAGIVSDLSKQKELTQKLKESENLFRTLIEQSSSGVYIHDPVKNKLFYANPLIRKILNIKEEDMEKTDLFEYLHPDDAKLIKERTKKRLAGEKIDPSVELRIYPPDKKIMWVKAYTTFIKYKGVTAALASVIDITKSKEASLKEKEHLEELQRYKDATIGREMRVIELKREVNKICKEQGLSLKYKDTENKTKKTEEKP